MKIKILATGEAPTHYSFNNEVVTAYHNGLSESFDLSSIEFGDQFVGVSVDTLNLNMFHVIRDVYRDRLGELHLVLCQEVGAGHWRESDEFDSEFYKPEGIYAKYTNQKHAGTPSVVTSEGEQWVL